MKTIDLAQSIYSELDSSSISLTSIDYWLNQNIGKLNILLGSCFFITADSKIEENFSTEAAAIYKELYFVFFYEKASYSLYGAGAYSSSSKDLKQVKDGDSTITLVSNVERLSALRSSLANAKDYLKYLVDLYRNGLAIPLSKAMFVTGCRFDL